MMLSLAVAFPGMAEKNERATTESFLASSRVIDSLGLLETPPDTISARYAYDREQYEWGKSMRDSSRGAKAVADADLSDGWLDRAFSDAFGMRLTKENAPEIYQLMARMKVDAGDLAPDAAKRHYQRARPFMVFNESSATPDDEKFLRTNGSYPSGHTSIAWATALVLSEINPARQNEIMKRGYDFGQSRVIVGAHFQSDVDAGRLIGSGVVATLHSDREFQKQLAKAKKEFRRLSAKKKN